jgi:hypothetical protein
MLRLFAGLLAGVFLSAGAAMAQGNYPTKPIRMAGPSLSAARRMWWAG